MCPVSIHLPALRRYSVDPENGRWLIAPQSPAKAVRRNYRGDTLILETIFETAEGVVALIDFMPINEQTGQVDVIRLVEGREGSVAMRMELTFRFDYGEIVPWVEHTDDGTFARLADRMRSSFILLLPNAWRGS